MDSYQLRKALADKRSVFGPLIQTAEATLVEVAGRAGFDMVVIDQEHGQMDTQAMVNLVRAADAVSVVPFVRVIEPSETTIMRALDAGAQGVIVPRIDCADQARLAVQSMRFPPDGVRGACSSVRGAHYRADGSWHRRQNESNLLVALVEGASGIQDLESILDVEGIDVVMLGPYDLSVSMGYPGQRTHPEVREAMRGAVAKARERGIAAATLVYTAEEAATWASEGLQVFFTSTDIRLFFDVCTSFVGGLRDHGL